MMKRFSVRSRDTRAGDHGLLKFQSDLDVIVRNILILSSRFSVCGFGVKKLVL